MLTTVVLRTVVLYVLLLIVIRVMGKREIGRLSPVDLVVAIMMADAAVIAISDVNLPLLVGVVPVLVLAGAQVGLSRLTLAHEPFRQVINGQPAIVIRHGVIDEEAMRRNRYNLDDLLEQLRQQQVPNPGDVAYAVLEPSGHLSVVPKAAQRNLRPGDLDVAVADAGLPRVIVRDGRLEPQALAAAGWSRERVQRVLRERGIARVEDVLLLAVDEAGAIFCQVRSAPTRRLAR